LINNRQNGRRRGRGGGAQVRGPNNGSDRGNRIDNRARGNAAQLHEKYKNLARDAQTQGDRVMTEYYLQFADHYFRVLSESRSRFEEQNQQRRPRYDNEDYDGDGDEAEATDDGGEAEARDQQEPQQRYEREDRGDRRDDRPRRDYREPREPREPVAAAPAEPAPEDRPVEVTEERPRRGRRPRREVEAQADDASPRMDVDRLPPAFSAASDAPVNGHGQDGSEEPVEAAPRRRRTRRVTSEDSNVAA
jgi:hypothetical protein